MGEPARKLPEEDRADIRPDLPGLRALQGGGEGDGAPAGDLSAVEDNGAENSTQPDLPGLRALEGGGEGNGIPTGDLKPVKENDSLYTPDDTSGRFAKASSQFKRLTKNKLFVGIGATGGIGVVAFLIFVFLFFSALKIPNFMAHITAYQFARVTRQISQNATNITEEKIAIDSADSGLRSKIKARFNDSPTVGKVKETYGKLEDKYRPNKIIQNFNRDGTFKLNYNGDRLTGITLTDRTILVDRPTGLTRFVPGVKLKGNVNFSQEVAPALKAALKADDVGPIIRGRVASQIRKELGISLFAWKVGEYTGKSPAEAKLQNAKDMVKAIENDAVQESKTSEINKATKAFRDQLSADETDPKALTNIVDNGGIDAEATKAIEKSASGGFLEGFTSAISPFYAIAVPVCLIYDGSAINGNGDTINAQTTSQIKTYNYYASASSQIVNGYGSDAVANGALSARLGKTSDSPSEMRARGQSPDTSAFTPTQSAPTGEFTAFDAAFGGGAVASAANLIVGSSCKVLTNTGLALALGGVNILACLNPVGGTEACFGEKAAAEGAKTLTGRTAGRILSKIATEKAAQRGTAIGGYIASGVKDLTGSVVKITAATLITRMIVLQRANAAHNGLQSNTDLTSDIDSGGNQIASMVNQRQLRARPLNDKEVLQSHQADKVFMDEQVVHQSKLNKIGSLTNPDSLATKVGMLAISKVNLSVFNELLNLGSLILSPSKLISSLIGSLPVKPVFADGISATSDYGNVQWGYSQEETDLMNNDETFKKPLVNQEILDTSHFEDNIARHYGECFDGSKPIGTLLAEQEIVRDSSGNVKDEGLCSPKNLGPHNTDPDGGCGSNGCGDLVFRWRVATSYNNTLDQLVDQQDVTASDSTAASVPSTPVFPPAGDSKALAQSILSNPNIDLTTYSPTVVQDVKAAAAGQPGSAGVLTSSTILNLIATVGKDHKILVTAIQSGGQGHASNSLHYSGDAVDFGSIDGLKSTGRDANSAKVIAIATSVLPTGSLFGQSKDPQTGTACGPQITLPTGFSEIPDACTHLHIQIPRGSP